MEITFISIDKDGNTTSKDISVNELLQQVPDPAKLYKESIKILRGEK